MRLLNLYNNTNHTNKENNVNIYLYDSLSEIQKNKTIIDVYNDDNIIAGNSTIAHEILIDYRGIDKIFVPVLNKNLVAGILVGIKNIRPNIKVIGVKFDCLTKDDSVSIIANDICNDYLDDSIMINMYELEDARRIGYKDTGTIFNSNGAFSIAGIKKYTHKYNIKNSNIIGITNNIENIKL